MVQKRVRGPFGYRPDGTIRDSHKYINNSLEKAVEINILAAFLFAD